MSVYSRAIDAARKAIIIIAALVKNDWNVSLTAKELGLSRVGLSKRIQALGLKRPSKAPRNPVEERLAKVREAAREHPADCECWCCTTAPAPLAGEGTRP